MCVPQNEMVIVWIFFVAQCFFSQGRALQEVINGTVRIDAGETLEEHADSLAITWNAEQNFS